MLRDSLENVISPVGEKLTYIYANTKATVYIYTQIHSEDFYPPDTQTSGRMAGAPSRTALREGD